MTETVQMRGYVKADAEVKPGEMVFDWGLMTGALACFKYFCLPPCSARCLTTFKNMKKIRPHVEVVVSDARKKEAEEGLSKRQFFEKYGFVLMKHQTKMTNEDWLANTSRPGTDNMLLKEAQEAPSAVRDTYAPEIEPLIRELLPGASDIHFPAHALRRGPGGPNTHYGLGVHADFGLYLEDLQMNSRPYFGGSHQEFEERLRSEGTAGFSILNFWRPVAPMAGPVRDTPLAVLDPNTVEMEDVVPIEVHGFVPGGQKSLFLKFNADQKWYYYPDMTTDEVLILRQFHYEHGLKPPYSNVRVAFHSAFKNPSSSPGDEVRVSSEYRVGVWLK